MGSQLPREFHGAVGEASYVVFSYATPIAWRNAGGGWTCPDVNYSRSTSAQQGKIATAVAWLNATPVE